jgi:phage tail sheath protein FI
VNIGDTGQVAGAGKRRGGVQVLETVDEVAIVAAPGYSDPLSHEALLAHCELLRDRVAILDTPETVDDITALTRVALADKPAKPAKPEDGAPPPEQSYRPRQSDYGTVYFPWLRVRDPFSGDVVSTPPSGYMAGIWARTDALRGVHKAPANEPIRGAVDLTYLVTRAEQDVLNPKGVNCIRYFSGEGIRVWGARTLAAEASEWRYINVRRLFNMLEESISGGTRWMVFEPNDPTLWRSIRRDIGAFLTRVWRDGALLGRTPEEAFFVKCDEETNPADIRDAGIVVAYIGVAVVKPAEFVVFKLSQWAGGTETETIGS